MKSGHVFLVKALLFAGICVSSTLRKFDRGNYPVIFVVTP